MTLHISAQQVKKAFGSTAVLSGVSLEVQSGETVALIGSNGSGKSTLLRTLVRLIEPDSGTIEVLGEKVESLSQKKLRRVRTEVGFVFQKHNLVPRLSVLSNVVHGAQGKVASPAVWFQGTAPQKVREKALECLDLVGLASLAARRADQLSGGQSQRVAIARALMQEPRVMLADEPVASLDPVAGEEVMELFFRLVKEKGLTLLFSSHHLEHALRYADRVVGLRAGTIELDSEASKQSADELRGIYGKS